MFYLIGLGLGDADDITVKGLKIVKGCKRVYLEAYTSILTVGKEALEESYGREVIIADRDMVEQSSDEILAGADKDDVCLLVVGDPLGATTHTDLILRAKEKGIGVKVIHNASIMNAIGCIGLQLYNFGETISIVFWTETWRPDSYYDKIAVNRKNGFHTLCLLDIKVKEQTIENLMRGRKVYEPPRYMSASQAAAQLVEISRSKREEHGEETLAYTEKSLCVAVARVGADDQLIKAGTLEQMAEEDLGTPLHSLVIPGKMHELEYDYLKQYAIDSTNFPTREELS